MTDKPTLDTLPFKPLPDVPRLLRHPIETYSTTCHGNSPWVFDVKSCCEIEKNTISGPSHPEPKNFSGWWFQPILKKHESKWESSPNRDEHKKCLKPPPSSHLQTSKPTYLPITQATCRAAETHLATPNPWFLFNSEAAKLAPTHVGLNHEKCINQ